MAAAVELSRQQAGEWDQGKAESGYRDEDALVRLDKKAPAQGAVGIRWRREQLVKKEFLRLAKADTGRVVQRVEIERVAVERQERELARLGIELLTIAVHHDNSGTGRRIDKSAALGDDRNLTLGISAVVDQQTDHLSLLASA